MPAVRRLYRLDTARNWDWIVAGTLFVPPSSCILSAPACVYPVYEDASFVKDVFNGIKPDGVSKSRGPKHNDLRTSADATHKYQFIINYHWSAMRPVMSSNRNKV
ncbi:MAG: hypothetical protein WCH04_05585 [Gammaproteobacteria bacterium]